jgi:hypothetical protein
LFQYKKQRDTLPLKAKFAVIKNQLHLIYYDLPLDFRDRHHIDSLNKVEGETLSEAMKVAPDSIKKVLKQELPELRQK